MRALAVTAAAVFAVALAVALAGEGSSSGADGARPLVVATTTQTADLARNVAGSRAHVKGLLARNADPHSYELRPGDVRDLDRAAVVVRSGAEVDAWLEDAVATAGAGKRTLALGAAAGMRGGDPHWWQDPRRGARAALALARALARADRGGAAAYERSARAYANWLLRLDAAIARCWARVPRERRRLVTTHDAYGYYARRYGLTVTGTVLASASTRAQPSPRELSRLVRAIRRAHVRAIFPEAALEPRVERTLAQQAGVRVGRPLTGDALGSRGSASGTYAGALAADTRALVDGITGGRVECDLPRGSGA